MNKVIYVLKGYEKYWKQIQEIAEKENRSMAYIVNNLIKEYLENQS